LTPKQIQGSLLLIGPPEAGSPPGGSSRHPQVCGGVFTIRFSPVSSGGVGLPSGGHPAPQIPCNLSLDPLSMGKTARFCRRSPGTKRSASSISATASLSAPSGGGIAWCYRIQSIPNRSSSRPGNSPSFRPSHTSAKHARTRRVSGNYAALPRWTARCSSGPCSIAWRVRRA